MFRSQASLLALQKHLENERLDNCWNWISTRWLCCWWHKINRFFRHLSFQFCSASTYIPIGERKSFHGKSTVDPESQKWQKFIFERKNFHLKNSCQAFCQTKPLNGLSFEFLLACNLKNEKKSREQIGCYQSN